MEKKKKKKIESNSYHITQVKGSPKCKAHACWYEKTFFI